MSRKLDIGISIAMIGLCAWVFWETLSLPPPAYDPIGPAAFPRALCVIISFLSIMMVIRAFRLHSNAKRESAQEQSHRLRPDLMVFFAVLTMIYVLSLTIRLLNFSISTTVYVALLVIGLMRFDLKRLPIAIILGLIMGFGCGYIFTRIFYIDLP
jgi:putative tricarboxylic transport membrane protein